MPFKDLPVSDLRPLIRTTLPECVESRIPKRDELESWIDLVGAAAGSWTLTHMITREGEIKADYERG
jgi:hypothetical protein